MTTRGQFPKELMEDAVDHQATKEVKERFTTSYVARLSYKGDILRPPEVPGVTAAIDVHCHAHGGQQDGLAIAKHASRNGMAGILYKTIVPDPTPQQAVRNVETELTRWGDAEGVAPCAVWSAHIMGNQFAPLTRKLVEDALDDGAAAVWLPVFTHASTLSRVVAGRPMEPGMPRKLVKPEASFDEAIRAGGHYVLDSHGNLLPEIKDVIKLVADRGAVLSFGHVGRQEQRVVAEECQKLGYTKAFIDHPFSPFIALTVDEMREFAAAGVYLNFTYDEISPLLGTNPKEMIDTIAAVGPEHCLLSSDAGEPLFPDSVECMRLMRAYAEAFGLSSEQAFQMSTSNPAKLLNHSLN